MEETISLIIQIATLLGIIVGVILFVRKPQEDLETKQAITDKDVSTKATLLAQKEAEGKATLLAQQVQWAKEANEEKFKEVNCRLKEAMALAENHIHTVDVKVDTLIETVSKMSNEIIRLSTIINERIPKK